MSIHSSFPILIFYKISAAHEMVIKVGILLRKGDCTGPTVDGAILQTKILFSLIFFMHSSLKGDNLSKDNSLVAADAGELFKLTPTEHNFFSFVSF